MADEAVKLEELQSESELPSATESPKEERSLGRRRLVASAQDLGRADSLRHAILTLVTNEDYPRAIDRLKEYEASKHEYPHFKQRAGRYISYSCDLINAIKAKRSFPGFKYLAMAKQKELYERAQEHFNDLTATLRRIEQIDREVRAEDLRSTVWIVKALIYSTVVIMTVFFLREVSRGVVPTSALIIDDVFNQLTNRLFDSIGM